MSGNVLDNTGNCFACDVLGNIRNCFWCDCFGYDRLENMVGNIENMLGNIRNRFVCDRLIVRRQIAQLERIFNQFIKVVVRPLAAPVVPIIPMALARIIALAHVSSKSLTVALAEDVGSPLLRSLYTLPFVSRPFPFLPLPLLPLPFRASRCGHSFPRCPTSPHS